MKELTKQEMDVYTGGDPGMVLVGGGGAGGGGFGSAGIGGFNLGFGDFNLGSIASDLGGPSYTPATLPNGLFGMSIAETLGVGTGILALGSGIGQGVGASLAIEAAGGWSAIGGMGPAATGLVGSAAVGLLSSAAVGAGVGTLIYNYSPDWAQTIMQDAVGHTVEAIFAIPDAVVAINAWIVNVPTYSTAVQVQP
jgi:hypothetical protein